MQMGNQTQPVHWHEDTIDADEGDPEMDLAEAFVEASAKHFGEPKEQGAQHRERRGDAHHEVEVSGNEVVAHRGGSEIVTRQKQSGQPARKKERDEAESEEHRRRQLDLTIPESAE